MALELKVPEVGESITEVVIGTWKKREGEGVALDESVVEIESDKATVELPAPAAGMVTKILKASGEKAIVVVPTFTPHYPVDLLREALSHAHLMYLMPQHLEQFAHNATIAHACGAEVMIDVEPTVGAKRDTLFAMLRHVDIASFNQFGFRAATGDEPTIVISGSAKKYMYGLGLI